MRLSYYLPIFDGDIALPCAVQDIPSRAAALQPVQERARIRRLWQADREAMAKRRRKPLTVAEWLDRYGRRTA
jgi:hypothetical protein